MFVTETLLDPLRRGCDGMRVAAHLRLRRLAQSPIKGAEEDRAPLQNVLRPSARKQPARSRDLKPGSAQGRRRVRSGMPHPRREPFR